MSLPRDPLELLAIASDVLDGARDRFVAGLGAPSAVRKGPRDFATAVDLELEKSISAELERRTGIEVHGEEFGGPELSVGDVWILDPIDGTFNYSAGLPTAGMLLALLRGGVPVLGLTWLPLTDERFAATEGGSLLRNGVALPKLQPSALSDAMIGFGAFNIDSRGRIPGAYRFELLGQLSRVSSRIRMHGSTGADLAYTAAGILDGAVVFGHHVWDNAAGVALVRAAGGVVTDLRGDDWHVGSRSVLAAAPGVHAELLDILHSLGDPEERPEGGPRQ
ncbi:myo-inositol-1(or 4)-monophosphatase [Rhodococcus sp. LBL1]|uniref:inositol-phosphate phosphatase n=1 Tax=Prescottella agglutinans TaxID=1644129 RepID=A0ABT6M6T9_9NOCA|nr:inositol monophosphatase family protein [Prescottella agglutinans]MDH6280012.1 myo-inositol-1(or 4)-monophosphatase [Prescottella agglutinans]MDH6679524.1 myo-inositol-1(or 4)-monophosphatase [Rhodococcus sp. LBL1]MDH6685337.1 myo-inositol-1(or 4)-monophosphatase [Rhodococcus sp. LBL2]